MFITSSSRARPSSDPPAEALDRIGPARRLDSLRGLASLAVVFTHVFSMAPPMPELMAWVDVTPLRVIHTGRAPVLFFFVLSGYVLALSLLRPGAPRPVTFALRRTVRLLPPVAGAVLLSAAICALFNRGQILNGGSDVRNLWSEPLGASMILRQALLLGADGWFTLDIPLWSLLHEWRLSIVFPLVLLFRHRPLSLLTFALALHVATIALGVAPDSHQLGPRLVSTVLSSGYFALPFACGAALAFRGAELRLRGRGRRLAWAGVLAAAALPSDIGYIGASLALIILALEPGAFASVLSLRPLLWLGGTSFSVYLVHMPVLAATVHLTHGVASPWAALATGVPLSLLVAAAFHRLVEAPSHRLSRQVGERR